MSRLINFQRSETGTVAMIYAMIALAAFVLIGGGLDFSKHRTQSAILQTALDATALHMLREVQLDDDEFQDTARRFFDANLSGFDAVLTEFNVQNAADIVTVEAAANVETSFLGLLGIETLEIYRLAEGILSTETREIALVLDTTSSMQGTKIAELKAATNLLLDNLEAASERADNIRVSMVPFNAYIRVNPSDFPDAWLDDEGRSDIARELFGEDINVFDLFEHLDTDWSGCLRTRGGDLAFSDDPIVAGDPNTRFTPLFAYDEGDDGSYVNNYLPDLVAHSDGISSVQSYLKYGIELGEENSPNDWETVTRNTSGGPNFRCTSEPIIPLTNNFNDLRGRVNDLVAAGRTNTTEALVWGQRVLSSHAPYTDGLRENAPGNRKILIFLSDGENSIQYENADLLSVMTPQGYAATGELETLLPQNSTADNFGDYLDDEFAQACENIKDANIQLIVIRLELDDVPSLSLLSECATSEDDFFDVPDADQLEDVFGEISRRVTQARLSR